MTGVIHAPTGPPRIGIAKSVLLSIWTIQTRQLASRRNIGSVDNGL